MYDEHCLKDIYGVNIGIPTLFSDEDNEICNSICGEGFNLKKNIGLDLNHDSSIFRIWSQYGKGETLFLPIIGITKDDKYYIPSPDNIC